MEQNGSPAGRAELYDYGPNGLILSLRRLAGANPNYRTALWTGRRLQLTLMSIPPGGDIGLESHPNLDQFIYVEQGEGVARMGTSREALPYTRGVAAGDAVIVPAGAWHNLVNTGAAPLKLYSIYAPPQHPWGTVQATKAIAQAEEGH